MNCVSENFRLDAEILLDVYEEFLLENNAEYDELI